MRLTLNETGLITGATLELSLSRTVKTYTFRVVVEPDEDASGNPAWHAYCPALESLSAASSGRTRDEALKNINEVVHRIVEEFFLKKAGRFPRAPPAM